MIELFREHKFNEDRLKELPDTPFQVVVGSVLGVISLGWLDLLINIASSQYRRRANGSESVSEVT